MKCQELIIEQHEMITYISVPLGTGGNSSTFFIQAEVQMLLQYSSTSQKVSEMPKSKKAAR